ncbi:MAG: hypothetical protein ACQETL_00490 [Bacteroidota bacterium]
MKEHNFTVNIIWIFFFLQVVFLGFVNAQNSIDHLQNQEKVFLHLDKSYYLSGSSLNYSAFVVEAKDHRLSKSANLLDVKLINSNNDEIIGQKALLKNGKASGFLNLDKSIPSGAYLLLAYTENSANSNFKYSFKQKLSIVNPNDELALNNQNEFNIEFYPEGGQLIGGHINSVAFKTNQPKMDWKGVIVSNLGDTIANLKSEKLNYGQFSFLAVDSLNYRAKIEANNALLDFQLPKVHNDNINSRIVNIKSDTLSLVVNIGKEFSANELSMLVYNNSEVILGVKQFVRGRRMIFNIPQSLLGNGLNSIFLYSEDQVFLSERNYFKSEKATNENTIKLKEDAFVRNKEVSLPISLDRTNLPSLDIQASVSIRNMDYFDSSKVNDMKLYFNMFSELNILDPSREIKELSHDSQFTDLYLKTKSTNLKNVAELNYQNDVTINNNSKDYFTVSGTVIDENSNLPIKDSVIYCSVIGQVPQFYASKTDDEGRFYFKIRSYYGESDIILKVANIDENESNLKYKLNRNIVNVQQFGFDDEISVNPDKLQDYINHKKQNDLISRVYNPNTVQGTRQKELKSTTGFFPNYSDSKDLMEYEYIEGFKQLSRELLPGLALKKSQGSDRIYLREIDDSGRNSFIGRFESEPLILIDGLPIFDNSKLMHYNTSKIKLFSLINKKYFINGVIHDGIVEIGTRDSDFYKQHKTNHFWFNMQGLFQETEKRKGQRIYAEQNEKDKLPDFRDVLYWNSDLLLSADKENTLNFSTSDDSGEFLIDIQGVDKNGNIVQKTSVITVID